MKILICNKFWYNRGGDCNYAIGLKSLLEKYGHKVAEFAMEYEKNFPSEWSGFWPSEMKGRNITSRVLGSKEVSRSFSKMLDLFKPDIVHLNNIHTQLSPVIGQIAHKRDIPVVWTIHDYKLLCPRYDCLRNGKDFCTECFSGNKRPLLLHSCMKNSRAASVIAYLEARKWNRELLESFTDKFICPSLFMRNMMASGGFNSEKLINLHNFIEIEKCRREDYLNQRDDFCCYVGRLSQEKGVRTLIEAANLTGKQLVVIGDGPLYNELKAKSASNVSFVGRQNWDMIKDFLSRASFSIIPSECYENNPLSAIESLCLGTPVLGSDIGGIPELIDESNGMLFKTGSAKYLAEAINSMFIKKFDYQLIAESSWEIFSQDKYYNNLITIYSDINKSVI